MSNPKEQIIRQLISGGSDGREKLRQARTGDAPDGAVVASLVGVGRQGNKTHRLTPQKPLGGRKRSKSTG